MTDFQDAKQMYIYFLGSRFHMDREGFLQQYLNYKTTPDQEKEWRQEIITTLITQLPNIDILWKFGELNANEAISDLIKFKDYGNGFFRCRLAETLFDITYKSVIYGIEPHVSGNIYLACSVAKAIWSDLIQNPNQRETFMLNGTNETVNDDYIRRRAHWNLSRQKELIPTLNKYGFTAL